VSRFIEPDDYKIGVGATESLSLRVSVATLVRVLFYHPENGQTMLVLERTATLREIEGRSEITVRAKPFGGAVRLINPQALRKVIGNFHYDSEQSCQENDFRILIDTASWKKVMDICRQQLNGTEKRILDSSPMRELTEEFEDTLHVRLTPGQYDLKPFGIVVEATPVETDSVRAEGFPTARVYYLFEARIGASEIITMLLDNHKRYSDEDLEKMAWEDARRGGRGRANAILALKLDELKDVYRSIPIERRHDPIKVGSHQLDGNVWAVLG
jgi:hypothetical protein